MKFFDEFEKQLPSLEGKTVAITGCTTGTGLVAAVTTAKLGAANILMINRPSDRGDKAEEKVKEAIKEGSNAKVESIECDLRYFESVQEAADTIKKKYKDIDVLCNNAGIMGFPDKPSPDGYDIQMQVNHLSHFLLTKELFPLLKKAAKLRGEARIVNHCSKAVTTIETGLLEKKYLEKTSKNKLGGDEIGYLDPGPRFVRYGMSKFANSVFTAALSEKVAATATEGNEIKVVGASSGLAATNLHVNCSQHGAATKLMSYVVSQKAQSAEDGTMPLLAAMYDPTTENGDFWEPEHLGLKGKAKKTELDEASRKQSNAAALWQASEDAVGAFTKF